MADPAPSQAAPVPTTILCSGSTRQRDPPVFSGADDQDVEDWIAEYERVSSCNKWDGRAKLTNVHFYITDVAALWYKNHENEIMDWSTFTTAITEVFGRPSVRRLRAEQRLRSRVQRREETFTSYIEDVLSLCKRVDPSFAEAEKIKHIMKGVDDDAFQMLVARNPQTVADVIQLCQSYDELRKQRASTRRAVQDQAEISTLASDVAADHTALLPHIKQFIREEVARQLSLVTHTPEPMTSALDPPLRHVIETQVAQALPPAPAPLPVATPLTYASVVARQAPPVPGAYRTTGPLYTSPPPSRTVPYSSPPPGPTRASTWRTSDNLPICFTCGFAGHVARYCNRRRFRYQDSVAPPTYPTHHSQRAPSPVADSPSTRRPLESYRSSSSRRRSISPMLRRPSPAREEN